MKIRAIFRSLLAVPAFIFLLSAQSLNAQFVVDQVIGVVGSEKILLSDVEQELLRMQMQGVTAEGDMKCSIFEEQMIHKLLLHQAAIDSIEVTPSMVEGEMERRLRYFINQIGSEDALEKYFNKTMFQIRADLRISIREGLLAQQVQGKIVENVTVTPSEVRRFYRDIPQDSLPIIPDQYQVRQIVMYPPAGEDAKFAVREQLLDIRERVLKGERFSTLAVAYSEDRATATRGGELGFMSREQLVKSFADVAFNLREGQVSQIVESEYGFHIIQMIERRNDQVNVRHILMRPSYSPDQLLKAQTKLDSISNLIKTDTLTFRRAAQMFSEDENTRLSGGLMINPQSNTSLFEREHFLPADFYVIRNLKPGEISQPFESRDEHANVVYKLVMISKIIPQHRANLDDDYAIIQQMTKMGKQHEVFMDWVKSKVKTTYVRIDPSYRNCSFEMDGWLR
ncbi:peptidylprolyl isomerase [Perlabentimonas gracilis]|uniref:peptidylprolyl isomerase n=1 Tax=Perlabentimonas gracilis TaxID=2715279 RepID=UPI00140A77CB|nr:peptidylprolyl isomerase [Perlabentimonas gracilis]NHB69752.1 peptidylprolyl isomerase [Perlabentimonas gracilis]